MTTKNRTMAMTTGAGVTGASFGVVVADVSLVVEAGVTGAGF